MATSLRLPDRVKKRVTRIAASQDKTPHAFMLEAIQEKVDAEEASAAFHAEADRRLTKMKKSGMGIPAGEVFDYALRRAQGEPASRPKARKIT